MSKHCRICGGPTFRRSWSKDSDLCDVCREAADFGRNTHNAPQQLPGPRMCTICGRGDVTHEVRDNNGELHDLCSQCAKAYWEGRTGRR